MGRLLRLSFLLPLALVLLVLSARHSPDRAGCKRRASLLQLAREKTRGHFQTSQRLASRCARFTANRISTGCPFNTTS